MLDHLAEIRKPRGALFPAGRSDRFLGIVCTRLSLTRLSPRADLTQNCSVPHPKGPRVKSGNLAISPAAMAPPPAEFIEVRCAGCGETLEVEPALTEFACPDCGTQQALPPELMPPPPPRPRRALPIPGRGPAAAVPVPVPVPVAPAPASLPCAACAALLSVPAGLARFACPLCAVELTVDGGHLRAYLASPPRATVSVLAPPPAGITLSSRPSPHRRPEVRFWCFRIVTRTHMLKVHFHYMDWLVLCKPV